MGAKCPLRSSPSAFYCTAAPADPVPLQSRHLYCHWPLLYRCRRYPDIIVHRLMAALLDSQGSPEQRIERHGWVAGLGW